MAKRLKQTFDVPIKPPGLSFVSTIEVVDHRPPDSVETTRVNYNIFDQGNFPAEKRDVVVKTH